MHPNLSFEQVPPISVPYRFFLTAPWFGVAAGLLVALRGEAVFASRWMPETLAAVHLLVGGFMLQAMSGALLQFVSVAAGGNIWRPRQVAALVHPLLVVAPVLLVAAFLQAGGGLFVAAAYAFALGLGVFVAAVGIAVWRTPATGATILALRLALVGLLVTLTLGVVLALGLGQGRTWPLLALTDVHAAWGLGGWALMLLAGVAYFVVPMFQLTPPYPARFARGLPPALGLVLLAWTASLLVFDERARTPLWLAGLGIGAAFGAVTLHLHARQRRKVRDVTLDFFRVAMGSLILVWLSACAFALAPAWGNDPRAALWLGTLAILGIFVSSINGMLYKIVPFLNWLHLQRLCGVGALPPTMNRMIPESAQRRQCYAHLTALALALCAVWLNTIAWLAGLALAASCAWLGWNLLGAVRVYRDSARKLQTARHG